MTNQTDAPEWVRAMYADVEKKWRNLAGNSSTSKTHSSGYALFYGPVYSSCDLMIIGFNPGGGSESFEVREVPPGEHEYSYMKYALAEKMRKIFYGIGANSLLARSVKTNLIFFRSKNFTALNQSLSRAIRNELAEFCREKLMATIEILKPKVIITEGIGVFDTFKRHANAIAYKEFKKDDRRRLYVRATWKDAPSRRDITLIGLIHPTGAHVAPHKWEYINSLLKKDLKAAGLL